MKFLIITHVLHGKEEQFFAYAPYVRELNIWTKNVDEVVIIAPIENYSKSALESYYQHSKLRIAKIPVLNFQYFSTCLKSSLALPKIFFKICKEMRNADHIHLRCPGNIGLLGCFAQLFFPSKQKSAKYAGNWDPNSKQPISYRLQKFILSNTFLTRNMTALVYGDWQNQTKNIKSFFTATYSEEDKVDLPQKDLKGLIRFLFVGTLTEGKRPLYALQIVEILINEGFDVRIDFYGEGLKRRELENYIQEKDLKELAKLHGNKEENVILEAYKEAHFLILPSKSEGWPKVVAEAMFWQCLPVSTSVSCVPNILDNGKRGILLYMKLQQDVEQIKNCLNTHNQYHAKVEEAMQWSRHFTLNLFEVEIQQILNK